MDRKVLQVSYLSLSFSLFLSLSLSFSLFLWLSTYLPTHPPTYLPTSSLQILFKCPTPAIVFGNTTKPSRFAHFWQGAQSRAPATRNEVWTPKSGPNPLCFVHCDFEMCFAPQRRALFPHLTFQKWSGVGVFCALWLRNVLRATTACAFSTSQLPKVVRSWFVLYILTSKCASRHNRVHFFHISTSKSGPELVCFVHFDFEMRFAPQRRALFPHLNFQKWSGVGVFCTFWFWNVLRATTACTFSTSQLHKRASRHNGVQFLISHLPNGLRTRRFSEPTFRPSGATNHWMCFATFLPFRAPGYSFFWDLLFVDLLSSSLLFSDSSHLCFSFVHVVGSLTSKLPSIIINIYI